MTWEQYKKAVELNERIEGLEAVQRELLNYSSLWYAYGRTICGNENREVFPKEIVNPIRHILDKHDKMIRQEINDEIKKLKSEIETL